MTKIHEPKLKKPALQAQAPGADEALGVVPANFISWMREYRCPTPLPVKRGR